MSSRAGIYGLALFVFLGGLVAAILLPSSITNPCEVGEQILPGCPFPIEEDNRLELRVAFATTGTVVALALFGIARSRKHGEG